MQHRRDRPNQLRLFSTHRPTGIGSSSTAACLCSCPGTTITERFELASGISLNPAPLPTWAVASSQDPIDTTAGSTKDELARQEEGWIVGVPSSRTIDALGLQERSRGSRQTRDAGHPQGNRRSAPCRRLVERSACASVAITRVVRVRGSCLVTTSGSTRQQGGISTSTDRLAVLDGRKA